jgi:HlyD family secretion protein
MMRYLAYNLSLLLLFGLGSCQHQQNEADAYGSFEATTVTVSPAIGGRIIDLEMQEGQTYAKGQTVGWVDTTQLHLKKEKLIAKRQSIDARLKEIDAQSAVFNAQIDKLNREIERFQDLVQSGGATQKQVDDLQSEKQVLKRKKAATASKKSQVRDQKETVNCNIATIANRIDKCRITLPVMGTVLDRLKEQGEFARPGAPISRVAKLDHLELKTFITGSQLPKVELGQEVTVRIDKNEDDYIRMPGKITWIADEAAFSPKNIKTKEERANLVYAMDVRVVNDGRLKISMPGEVLFEKSGE